MVLPPSNQQDWGDLAIPKLSNTSVFSALPLISVNFSISHLRVLSLAHTWAKNPSLHSKSSTSWSWCPHQASWVRLSCFLMSDILSGPQKLNFFSDFCMAMPPYKWTACLSFHPSFLNLCGLQWSKYSDGTWAYRGGRTTEIVQCLLFQKEASKNVIYSFLDQ